MLSKFFTTDTKKFWPMAAMAGVLGIAVMLLRNQGRLWICSCGRVRLWSGDVWSSENSQHLLDPYSLTHALHGFIIAGLLAWLVPNLRWAWRIFIGTTFEASWEVLENTNFVINRYREETAALGYYGDSIINSLGDIMLFGIGFFVARYLGLWRTVAVFVATELLLLFWIKDGLILNIIMLIYPLDSIKQWQMAP